MWAVHNGCNVSFGGSVASVASKQGGKVDRQLRKDAGSSNPVL